MVLSVSISFSQFQHILEIEYIQKCSEITYLLITISNENFHFEDLLDIILEAGDILTKLFILATHFPLDFTRSLICINRKRKLAHLIPQGHRVDLPRIFPHNIH